jgi:sugar phosphate isomerase/epimerase
MLKEMAELGFAQAELSHGIRITLVPGILRAVKEGMIRISSTHNFCPLPTGVGQPAPNLFEPSAQDPREREQWLRHTKRSIDFAADLGAKVVICHLGSVRFPWLNPARTLRQHLRKHPKAGRTPDDKSYQALLQKCLARLRKRMPPFWAEVRSSVQQILDYAAQKNVKNVQLGFENREKFEELPADADFAEFIEGFDSAAPVGYWHDTGHADIKEGMGLVHHRMLLERMARRTLGFHLHDVSGQFRDHQPLGAGHVDFEMVSRFWRPEHLLTLEFSPQVAVEHVRDSKQRVEKLMG